MRLKTILIDVIPTVIVTAWAMSWALPNAGTWVGNFKPAAAPMVLLDAENIADVIVFSGSSARLWPQCSPKRIEWAVGPRNGHNDPLVVNWGPPIKKPDGVFSFDGWTAEMTDVALFTYNSFSDVIHTCRIFTTYDADRDEWIDGWELPFEIRTKFYR